jgi:uncharacterized protein YndB with AHSA1/START domain
VEMSKSLYVIEHEINASKKMLYPYLNTASGLAQWFADDVNINEDHIFTFNWDSESFQAKMTSHRLNTSVKFEFIEDDEEEPWYIEFMIEENELTQSLFLKVTEYTEFEDEEEWNDLWENLFLNLKETIGG